MGASDSILMKETEAMEGRRRAIEKDRHRKRLGIRVEESERQEDDQSQDMGLEGEQQYRLKENPWLIDRQDLDGIPPKLGVRPTARDFDNLKREQELQKKLRLGLINMPSSAPKPRGPA